MALVPVRLFRKGESEVSVRRDRRKINALTYPPLMLKEFSFVAPARLKCREKAL